MEFYKKGSW